MPNSTDIGYWTCVRCKLPALHSTAEVNVDDFGCYFICIGCGRRNNLRYVPGTGEEPSAFVQIDVGKT